MAWAFLNHPVLCVCVCVCTWSLGRYGVDPAPPATLMPSPDPAGLTNLNTSSSCSLESLRYVSDWFRTTFRAGSDVTGRGSASETVADGNSRVCSEAASSSSWNTSSTLWLSPVLTMWSTSSCDNKGSHSFTCHPHVYPQMEWTILENLPDADRHPPSKLWCATKSFP